MKQDILKTSSKMSQWNCCRTCLSVDSLNTIFAIPLEHHKFSDIIQSSAGIKVVFNDYLPQEMCEECISFINKCTKFRRKCELSQKTLNERFQQGQFCDIKVESLHMFKCEKSTATIDISDDNFETLGSNLRNIEQNINSNSYDYVDNFETGSEVEKTDADNKNPQIPIEFVSNVQNREDKSIESIFISRKSRRKTKPVSIKKSRKVIKKRTKKSYKNLENNQPVDHMNDTKEIENEKETTIRNREKQKIECEYCQKILTSKLSLRNHYKIHTGFDVVCEHCGKKFITRRLLLSHCRAKHGYEKTDKCSYCDYRASNAEQVKIHERLHTGEKPFVCKECSAGFHRKSSYLQHIAIHLPEKTVQCDECPALFKSVTLMRIHKNKHRQPQYSFKCYICHSSFARRRNVIRHLQRIHAVVDTTDIERVKIG